MKILRLFLILPLIPSFLLAEDLVPLYPLGMKGAHPAETDTYFELNHTDDNPEYYLGSGALDDTFFVVFQPLAPCSVKYVEAMFYDSGTIRTFAADYSAFAEDYYPLGQAPNRGSSTISPIGDFFTDVHNAAIEGTNRWEPLNFGDEQWVVGNPASFETPLFGVGFIKNDMYPHPLSDCMDIKGIRYTYTWFGGPWMSTYPYLWGAYSSNILNGTVIDVMMRVWVIYPWGHPIIISDLTRQSDTFSTTGPFHITCSLIDMPPGIGTDDIIELRYSVNNGTPIAVELTDEFPPGDNIYGADISGNFTVGDSIRYWIYTENENEMINTTENEPIPFKILQPENPTANILIIDGYPSGSVINDYTELLSGLDVDYEVWSTADHYGIDWYVVNYYWRNIFIINSDNSSIPVYQEANPYEDFLQNDGRLLLVEPNYLFCQVYEDSGLFQTGDFAFDYFGLSGYSYDPFDMDLNMCGFQNNPVSCSFYSNPLVFQYSLDASYEIYFDPEYACFLGLSDERYYGTFVNGGFKTVFLNLYPNYIAASEQFDQLIVNILNYFDIPNASVEQPGYTTPREFEVSEPFPNPFNSMSEITLHLPIISNIDVDIYNLNGRLVEILFSGFKPAGSYDFTWDASEFASGLYFIRVKTNDQTKIERIVLLK